MRFCGVFFVHCLVLLFVLFLVIVLRFPLENPSENLPKLARIAGAGRSQRQVGASSAQLGPGPAGLAGPGCRLPASRLACKQLSRSQGQTWQWLPWP